MELTLHDAPASALSHARDLARVTAPAQLSAAQQTALARFPARRRKAVRRLALAHAYLADLLAAFPAALTVMAQGRASRAVAARRLVVAGAPLKEVAAALGLPLWTRRVPPEGCRAALLLPLPAGAEFSARIPNLLPRDAAEWPVWLEALSVAARIAGEPFALWLARELRRVERPATVDGIAALAVWAWYGAARRGPASDLVVTPWHSGLSLANAASAARNWIEGLDFLLLEEPAPIGLAPPADNRVGAFAFVPLAWGEPLVAEAHRMHNCLSGYAGSYQRGSRVWSVRRDGKPVADLELEFDGTRRGIPRLAQLHGLANKEADDEVWAAAYLWLTRWQLLDEPRPIEVGGHRHRPGAWIEVWRPLWQAHGLRPGMPHPVMIGYGGVSDEMTDALCQLTYLRRRG